MSTRIHSMFVSTMCGMRLSSIIERYRRSVHIAKICPCLFLVPHQQVSACLMNRKRKRHADALENTAAYRECGKAKSTGRRAVEVHSRQAPEQFSAQRRWRDWPGRHFGRSCALSIFFHMRVPLMRRALLSF